MPRRNAIPSEEINLSLPSDLKGQVDLHLFSPSQKRVPKGAYQAFFSERIREFFGWGSVDLAAYVIGLPPGSILRGPKALIKLLTENVLSRASK